MLREVPMSEPRAHYGNIHWKELHCPNCRAVIGKAQEQSGKIMLVEIGLMELTEFKCKCIKCGFAWKWHAPRTRKPLPQ